MVPERPSFEDLNAYVDNELSASREADVAQAIAHYPDLARQVAALARLRSAISESVETPALTLPSATKPKVRNARWVLAACIAVFCLMLGFSSIPFGDPAGSPGWLGAAWDFHGNWKAEGDISRIRIGESTILASGEEARISGAYLPDLSAAQLSLAFLSREPTFAGSPAFVAGYKGSRGCRLTLIVTSLSENLAAEQRLFTDHAKLATAWRVGNLDYLLIADGMDRARFTFISEKVYTASIEKQPFNEEVRVALQESRQKSRPCLA